MGQRTVHLCVACSATATRLCESDGGMQGGGSVSPVQKVRCVVCVGAVWTDKMPTVLTTDYKLRLRGDATVKANLRVKGKHICLL